MLHADSSHSSSSTKGERLSAKMRSLPSSSEPYETSSPKELGERAALLSSPPHICHTSDLSTSVLRRCVVRGPPGAPGGATQDRGQEAPGGGRVCGRRAGRRPAAGVDASSGPSGHGGTFPTAVDFKRQFKTYVQNKIKCERWTSETFMVSLFLITGCVWSTFISLCHLFILCVPSEEQEENLWI